MLLIVSIDDFVEAVKRHDRSSSDRAVYQQMAALPQQVSSNAGFGGQSGPAGYVLHVSYANPQEDLLIVAEMLIGGRQEADDFAHKLKQDGFKVFDGAWTMGSGTALGAAASAPAGPSSGPDSDFWIGAVAYKSAEDEPGVWVDVFVAQPTEEVVLKAMFDEFVRSGDLAESHYQDFLAEATPTVQVISARDVKSWLAKK